MLAEPIADHWNPGQYDRFASEREQPFRDLLAMVRPAPQMRVVDLGCGTGRLTAQLHESLGAKSTLGMDNSPKMLAKSAAFTTENLAFDLADIETMVLEPAGYDLIFSNAALHWVENHAALFARLVAALRPGGQLAVQMPFNDDHPAYAAAREVAGQSPFIEELGGQIRRSPVQSARWYAETLARCGIREQHVRVQVYGHWLDEPLEVLEWMKGTYLTAYEKLLSEESFRRYVATLGDRLREILGNTAPYFFSFARIHIWAGAGSSP